MARGVNACVVRPAQPEDRGIIQRLLDELGFSIDAATVAANLKAIDQSPSDLVLVAEWDRELVGFIVFHTLRVVYQPRPLGRIGALIVTEEAQGKGIGKALVAQAEATAQEWGCTHIEVIPRGDRHDAHHFYRDRGYDVDERRFLKRL